MLDHYSEVLGLDEAIDYRKMTHNQKNKSVKKNSPIAERNKNTTYLVSLFLHLKLYHGLISYQFYDLLQDIKKGNSVHFKSSDFFNNPMMRSWSIFEPSTQTGSFDGSDQEDKNIKFDEDKQNKMMYRFEPIPDSV